MDTSPQQILRTVFGYESFRGDQKAIIKHVVSGGDAVVLMPTGGGKSLCYQVPSLIRPGVGIVVSPLIALMQDQVSAMQQLEVRATFINSTLEQDEASMRESLMRRGEYDLVYVAPERLLTGHFLSCLEHTPLALFAIDEAHCVSQWGHDFRPEYIRLSALKQRFPNIPCIALTATADPPTRHEIINRLGLSQAQLYSASFNRPNIHYRILHKNNARKQVLRFIQEEHPEDSGIVYCLSRKKVEDTATFLNTNGFTALPYHAGLPANSRQLHQQRFLKESKIIIVATIAFGMGIDKPDVRFVAHLDMPKSLEAYYQETGRAGRDGLPSNAWMTYGIADVVLLRQLLEGSNAEERIKRIERHKLEAMLGFCETTTCRRQSLLSYFAEQLAEPCKNCDTCLEPVETWNGIVAAQKAMSCVYRTGQRFGVNYLVDVLRGKQNGRIEQFGHHRVSTYGIGNDLNETEWKSVYRQLVAAGLLAVDIDGHGGLKLTEKSRDVLKGKQPILFRKDPVQTDRAKNKTQFSNHSSRPEDENGMVLWESLRSLRYQLSQEQNVPPYVIFHDSTLNEIVKYRPKNLDELQFISGIGESKLKRYGATILEVIEKHAIEWGRPNDIPALPALSLKHNKPEVVDTVAVTLELFKKRNTPTQIAAARDLKCSTIYGHLAEAIEAGEIETTEVIGVPKEEIHAIECAFEVLDSDSRMSLRPVYNLLEEKYDYGILRCVRAGMIVRGDFPSISN